MATAEAGHANGEDAKKDAETGGRREGGRREERTQTNTGRNTGGMSLPDRDTRRDLRWDTSGGVSL